MTDLRTMADLTIGDGTDGQAAGLQTTARRAMWNEWNVGG
jgi:hypothetical protein